MAQRYLNALALLLGSRANRVSRESHSQGHWYSTISQAIRSSNFGFIRCGLIPTSDFRESMEAIDSSSSECQVSSQRISPLIYAQIRMLKKGSYTGFYILSTRSLVAYGEPSMSGLIDERNTAPDRGDLSNFRNTAFIFSRSPAAISRRAQPGARQIRENSTTTQ